MDYGVRTALPWNKNVISTAVRWIVAGSGFDDAILAAKMSIKPVPSRAIGNDFEQTENSR
jgi:hypothetical protein